MICCTIYAHMDREDAVLTSIRQHLGFFQPQLDPTEPTYHIQMPGMLSKYFGTVSVMTRLRQNDTFVPLLEKVILRVKGAASGEQQEALLSHLADCQCAVGIAYDEGMSRKLFPNLLELCGQLDGVMLLENGDFLAPDGSLLLESN